MAPIFDRLRRRRADMPFCTAVVPAAGSSTRMEGQDKILLTLGDYPVLVRTLQALEACTRIQEIVVVTREDLIVPVSQLCRDFALEKVTHIVTGGTTRTQSVLNGIREASPQAGLIAIHDGARPFVTQEVLEEVIDRAAQCGAAAPAVPVTDTVKRAMNGIVEETVDPSGIRGISDQGCPATCGGGGGHLDRRLCRSGAAGHEGSPHPRGPGQYKAYHPY